MNFLPRAISSGNFQTVAQGRETEAEHSGLAELKRQRVEFEQVKAAAVHKTEYW